MNIFLLETRNLRKSVLGWTLSVSAVILLMLAFYPSMKTDAMQALTNAKLDSLDPALLAAFGISKIPDFTIVSNFFGYVLQFITISLMVFVSHQTISLLVKEESDGTIEYLYSKPVSRGSIFAHKTFAHIISFFVMVFVFNAVTLTGYLAFSDYTFAQSLKETSIMYGSIFYVGMVFSAVGLLASSIIRSNRSAAAITIAIVFGTFVIGAVSAVVKELDFLIYLSPMEWIKAEKLMSEGIRPLEWVIGIGLIIACPAAALIKYRKKDLLI